MIDLELTEDHKALIETVREFAQKEVAPYIKEWDERQHFERRVFEKMAELNLLGVCIPEQYGGAGFGLILLGLVCGEAGAGEDWKGKRLDSRHGPQSPCRFLFHKKKTNNE